MKEQITSRNENIFIIEALRSSLRLDGRRPFDTRSLRFEFGEQYGQVEVQLGETRVLVVVTAKVVPPRPERPTEGFFQFFVEFSPMASLEFEPGARNTYQTELSRVVERGLRESRAIDTESLCILAGEQVWRIKSTITILDNGGNLIDCASIALITGLLHFRRPEVTVIGDDVTVHSFAERQPVPLSIHHIPISVTFGIFDDGSLFMCDPTHKEEVAMEGRMTITLNAQEELCAIQKPGGIPISVIQILECTRIAAVKVKEIDELIKQNLEKDAQVRKPQSSLLSTTVVVNPTPFKTEANKMI